RNLTIPPARCQNPGEPTADDRSLLGIAGSACRFQVWPAGAGAQQAGPASVPCPPRLGSRPALVPAERDGYRCWLVGGGSPGPNRPTQPAWNWPYWRTAAR